MPTDFQDFLRQKADGTGVRERNRNRGEWLLSLQHLLTQIEDWLREADTENLLETIRYDVESVEDQLGIYDAPALKIRLGADEVDVVPVGRYAIGRIPAQALGALWGYDSIAGRVDITDGERKYLLLRDISGGEERWHAVADRLEVVLFDRAYLETILQDLWS